MKQKAKQKISFKEFLNHTKAALQDPDQRRSMGTDIKNLLVSILKFLILVGVSYVILSPVIGMIAKSFCSDADAIDPMVYVIPKNPTLSRYALAILRMDYFPTIARDLVYTLLTTLMQLFICSMVGYGFARFNFPFKNVLFALVVVMIVIPSHTIMLPLYMTFKEFDPFGLATLITGAPINLMGTTIPMYIMTMLGCGVRSGLYIYIFNQFFRGLPKEIEEAALVDGAGVWYTYFRIMLRNAMPAVITVAVFSIVWQFNDTFYAKLFLISPDVVISKKIATLQSVIANQDKIMSLTLQELYLDAGIILILLPIVLIYVLLQRYFIEGVERSGIVG